MEIRELRAFIAVAEEGSFSAAARKLHVSQSALSQTIRSLERQLGVRLLERHSAGVSVTDAGGLLLREARALLAQHDRVLAAVTGQAAAGPATLRVGVPLELPGSVLPRGLADMGAAFPQTRAEISHASSAAQLAALEAGDLDLALARECPPGPGYDAVLVAEEPLGVLLSPAWPPNGPVTAACGCISWRTWNGPGSPGLSLPPGMTRSPARCAAMASTSATGPGRVARA